MKIFILRAAVKVHHAMISPIRFMADCEYEKTRTSAMEMFVGKAYEHGMEAEISMAENWADGQVQALRDAYKELIKSKRYKVKGALIDRYYFNKLDELSFTEPSES